MTGKQKTAAEQKQSRLEAALRANLGKRKTQARARDEKPRPEQKQPDESPQKR